MVYILMFSLARRRPFRTDVKIVTLSPCHLLVSLARRRPFRSDVKIVTLSPCQLVTLSSAWDGTGRLELS